MATPRLYDLEPPPERPARCVGSSLGDFWELSFFKRRYFPEFSFKIKWLAAVAQW